MTHKDDKPPNTDEFYYSKHLPGKEISIKKGRKGFQIVPYETLSQGSRIYTLVIPMKDQNIRRSFYYRSVRSDIKDELNQ